MICPSLNRVLNQLLNSREELLEMEKVKISKEAEKLLISARHFHDGADLVETFITTTNDHTSSAKLKVVMDVDTLIRALYIGYEVEKSKEDQVREVISSFCNGAIVSDWVIENIKNIYKGAE